MAAGIGIGIYYGWKLALLVLAICPLMAFGLAMRIKYKEEGATKDAELFEEAGKVSKYIVLQFVHFNNIQVAVEAIENIRTVQFLTREKRFYDDFVG
jgi:hypothetical protein